MVKLKVLAFGRIGANAPFFRFDHFLKLKIDFESKFEIRRFVFLFFKKLGWF